MRRQLRTMGASWDWSREAISADPAYYRWTQWFFLRLFQHGLAYKKMAAVDWCPKDNTTLAREQVIGEERVCERCKTPVIKKDLEQWFFRITSYADELLDFSGLDWPEPVRLAQTNWIGRSQGARVRLPHGSRRSDRGLHHAPRHAVGRHFLVLAPEHPLVARLTTPDRRAAVEAYVQQTLRQSDIQREATDKDEDRCVHRRVRRQPGQRRAHPGVDRRLCPALTYGTGAIMAVPAHDQRDFEFARAFGLEVRPVILPPGVEALDGRTMTAAEPAYGTMIESGALSGHSRRPRRGRRRSTTLEQQGAVRQPSITACATG